VCIPFIWQSTRSVLLLLLLLILKTLDPERASHWPRQKHRSVICDGDAPIEAVVRSDKKIDQLTLYNVCPKIVTVQFRLTAFNIETFVHITLRAIIALNFNLYNHAGVYEENKNSSSRVLFEWWFSWPSFIQWPVLLTGLCHEWVNVYIKNCTQLTGGWHKLVGELICTQLTGRWHELVGEIIWLIHFTSVSVPQRN